MKLGLIVAYQSLIIFSSFILALFAVSPVVMGLTCLAMKLNYTPAIGFFYCWLISIGAVALPIYIIEEISLYLRQKEETLQRMKEKSEAIKE